ncbi:MAG: hypothetical protein ACRD4U_01965, partial [Candidatus Acidiferrales bacterium]
MKKKNVWTILLALALAWPCLAPMAVVAQEPPSAQVSAQIVPQGERAPSATSLDELVGEALANNPGVQSALRRVEALRRRAPQARSLPDPMLEVGWMGNLKPFGVMRDDP